MSEAQEAARSVQRGRRGWLPAALGIAAIGVLLHLLLFVFLTVPLGEGPPRPPPANFVAYPGEHPASGQLLREQAALLDSKPLFMPTQWNVASSLQDIARLRDEAEVFARFEPVVRLHRDGWSPTLTALPRGSARPTLETLIRDDPVYPLLSFGQTANPRAHAPLPGRVGAISVEGLTPGSGSFSFFLPVLPEVSAPDRLWSPVEFMLVVDSRSTGGAPMRLNSSGIGAWDAALARYLASSGFRQRLSPGYYRITVGP